MAYPQEVVAAVHEDQGVGVVEVGIDPAEQAPLGQRQ